MNSVPLHPSVVHLPLALAVLMPLLSLALLVAWWRGWLSRRSWLVAAALQLVLVGSAFVALETGEIDEERVEKVLPDEAVIEAHEEAAEVFLWSTAGVLVLFLAGAVIPRERTARVVASIAVAGTVLVFSLGYRVGRAGGELVYQHGAASAYVEPSATVRAPGDRTPKSKRHKARRSHHDDHDNDDD